MISAVTLSRGALRAWRAHKVIVKHLAGDPELRQHRHPVQRQDGHADQRRDGARSDRRSVRRRRRARPLDARLRQQRLSRPASSSPLDAAILKHGAAADATDYRKIDEIPFDFERRRLSVVVETPASGRAADHQGGAGGRPRAAARRSKSTAQVDAARRGDAGSAARRRTAQLSARGLSRPGRRLPLACRAQAAYSRDDERELVLAGFVELRRPAAGRTSPRCSRELAARRRRGEDPHRRQRAGRPARLPAGRARRARRSSPATRSTRIDDAALGHVAEQATVFARVSPAQKNRIILALKRRGHVVGYIGDGINDAPSLHAADVGISVADRRRRRRDAADIILARARACASCTAAFSRAGGPSAT